MQQEQLLLDAIRDDPDDRESYAVYGDWLAQRGDPRGELIGLSLALERMPADVKVEKRVRQLQAKQAKELPAEVDVTWRYGFVCEAHFDPGGGEGLDVLRHPLLQLVETVALVDRRATSDRKERADTQVVDRFVELVPRTLRRFEIDYDSVAFSRNLVALFEKVPRLTELAMSARRFPAGMIDVLAPRLHVLELGGRGVIDKLLGTIATTAWPDLRRLSLRVPARRRAVEVSPLLPLMRTGFPALVDLRVLEETATSFTEQFCKDILGSPLLARLEVLDFCTRGLDVDLVRPSHPLLRHLKSFLPHAETETEVDALEQLTYLLEEPDTHRAIRLTRRVRDLANSAFDLHNINRRLGTALLLVGELDEALAALDTSLENEPACGVTLLYKAWALKRLERIDEALEILDEADITRRHPPNRGLVLYLRSSLADRADPEVLAEARDLLVEELATRVVDADLHYALTCTYALLGDTTAALTTLATTFELCPHYKAWAATEGDFAKLSRSKAFRRLLST